MVCNCENPGSLSSWCFACLVSLRLVPDDGGHDFCGEKDAEGRSGLGGEETQHREDCDGRLTEICQGGEEEHQ